MDKCPGIVATQNKSARFRLLRPKRRVLGLDCCDPKQKCSDIVAAQNKSSLIKCIGPKPQCSESLTETKTKCRIPSEEYSGVNKTSYDTVSYRVRVGAPPSCHRKEVRLALAIKLTKYRIVNSIQVRNISSMHFAWQSPYRKVVDSPTGEKSIWQEKERTQLIRGHGIVATFGVDVTLAPTSNVTVLSESVPAEKLQWDMLARCSLYMVIMHNIVLLVDLSSHRRASVLP